MNIPTLRTFLPSLPKYLCLALLSLLNFTKLNAQCSPDVTPPELNCKTVTNAPLGIDGTFYFTAATTGSPAPIDACDGTNLNYQFQLDNGAVVADSLLLTCNDIGQSIIKFWAADQSGNVDSCSIGVHIFDGIPPVLICDSNVQIDLPPSGQIEVNAWDFLDTAYSNICTLDSSRLRIRINDESYVSEILLDCSRVGTNTIEVNYPGAGSVTCVTDIVLNDPQGICPGCTTDVTPPVLHCNTGITISLNIDGSANFSHYIASTPPPTDACDGTNLDYLFQLDNETPVEFLKLFCDDIGQHTVKFWASDQSGNTDSCIIDITVEDKLNPAILCKNNTQIALPASGEIEVDAWDFLDAAFDNCPIDSASFLISIDSDPPVASAILDCSQLGNSTVMVSYLGDPFGACSVDLTLTDPLALCPDCNPDIATPQLACATAVTLAFGAFDHTDLSTAPAVDACDGSNLNYLYQINNETPTDNPSLTCTHIGVNTVTFWVSDQSGNTESCIVEVTVTGNPNPSLACDVDVQIDLPASGEIEVDAWDFLEGNYDCVDSSLFLIRLNGGPASASILLDCNTLGIHLIEVSHQGSTNSCWSDITVSDPLNSCAACNPDLSPPSLNCHTAVSVALGIDGTAPFPVSIVGSPAPVDACDGTNLNYLFQLNSAPLTTNLLLTCADIGLNTVKFWVSDQSGNTDSCTIAVTVEDKLDPVMICDVDVQIDLPASGEIEVDAWDFMDGSFDNCLDSSLFMIQIDGGPMVASAVLDCGSKGSHIVRVSYDGSINSCWTDLTVNDPLGLCVPLTISGKVFADTMANCLLDVDENGFQNINVEILNLQNNIAQEVSTNIDGDYTFSTFTNPASSDSYSIRLPDIPAFLLPCGVTQNLSIPAGATSGSLDFPTAFEPVCSLLTVDLSTPVLRRCFSNNEYFISYCNYSTFSVDTPYIELVFDDLLDIQTSSSPYTQTAPNTYRFDLPALASGECGTIALTARLDCAAQLNQTICASAQIFPGENCGSNGAWSGAQIEAESFCNGSDAGFFLRNVGTGDMVETANYLIVEDLVMYMNNPFLLNIGEQIQIDVPANGATWRLEAPQEQGYPGKAQPVAWLEGCGGINNSGLVTIFPTNNNDLFKSTFCLEVTGSYDPNDKQGFPRGYEDEHFIKANQSLDYMIRFQNTGNDTAFTVVIVDTLDVATLKAASIRPGSASHPYQFDISESGIVTFTFDNILLPDSIVNEPASHGFVKFSIQQQPDLPEGTLIENQAAIYFDFNAPIITNQTWHTIEFAPITTSASESPRFSTRIKVSPNPFHQRASFLVEGDTLEDGLLVLYNFRGQRVASRQFTGNQLTFERSNLVTGMYFYTLFAGNERIGQGKLVIE